MNGRNKKLQRVSWQKCGYYKVDGRKSSPWRAVWKSLVCARSHARASERERAVRRARNGRKRHGGAWNRLTRDQSIVVKYTNKIRDCSAREQERRSLTISTTTKRTGRQSVGTIADECWRGSGSHVTSWKLVDDVSPVRKCARAARDDGMIRIHHAARRPEMRAPAAAINRRPDLWSSRLPCRTAELMVRSRWE